MAVNPNSLANLEKGKETQFKSGEQAAINGQKGGKASAAAQRARRTLRDELKTLLSMPTIDKDTGEQKESTVQEALTVALVKQALKGNTKAFEIIRDTIGEKPTEHVSLMDIDQSTIDLVEKMVMAHDS